MARWEEAYSGGKVDREAGVIRGVKVLGLESRNRRRYLKEAVRKAIPLYEGAKVFIDHDRKNGERSFKDRWGTLTNVRADDNGELWGDLEYLKSHPQTEMILESIERFPDSFGLSHNADGEDKMQNGVSVVTEIVAVHSVDLVSDPATNKGLFEGYQMKKKLIEAVAGSVLAPVLARLLENEGYDDMAAMEIEPMEDTPEAHLDMALSMMVQKIIGDKSLSMEQKLEKFRKVLEMEAAMQQSAEPDAAVAEEMDKLKEENKAMKESLEKIQTEATCRQLLESLDRECTAPRLAALMAVGESLRKALVESWTARSEVGLNPAKRPAASPGKLQEGTEKYPSSFQEFIRSIG